MVFCDEFWMSAGLESRYVGRVYGADGAVHGTFRTVNKPYVATRHPMLLMMGVCTRNMSS